MMGRIAVGLLIAFVAMGAESKAQSTYFTSPQPGSNPQLTGGGTVNVSAYTSQGTPASAKIMIKNKITTKTTTTNATPASDGKGGWTVTNVVCSVPPASGNPPDSATIEIQFFDSAGGALGNAIISAGIVK
ncbi:MAG TPA: hypothetical protein VG406_25905 [Isosphaeraceae bacterium]|jgi:hypothetical protein|nr:hypothetical protein [Isosphaeraceae bacterium]